MTNYQPKKGDRVRVVLEGEVNSVDEDSYCKGTFTIGLPAWSNIINPDTGQVVSIEKIEPPVIQYGPGDVVRGKKYGIVRALGEDGYIVLNPKNTLAGRFYGYDTGGYALSCFNSETSELVEL